MDDPRWLRLVTIGLVLAALAVGYFLITGGFFSSRLFTNKAQKTETQLVQQSPTPKPVSSPSPSSKSAYTRIAERTTKEKLKTLPATGFPVGAVGLLSAGAAIAGWGLRRFPH